MAMNRLNYLFIMLITFDMSIQKEEECELPLPLDNSLNLPLIFSSNGSLISKSNPPNFDHETGEEGSSAIILNEGEEVILSCEPNYFKNQASEKQFTIKCKDEKTLLNEMEKDFLSDFLCDARSIDDIIIKPPNTVVGCPSSVRSVEYGYTNPIFKKSYVLGEACYSTRIGRTLFIHTKLRTQSQDVESLALKVKPMNYFRQEHPTPYYRNEFMKASRKENYEEFFLQTFGKKDLPKIKAKALINDILLTHIQHQPITTMSWNYAFTPLHDHDELENFEKLQEDISSLKLKNVELYSGTHGILSFESNRGTFHDVYLKEGKFPVPKYIWYVVKSDNKAVAFAMLNRVSMISNSNLHQQEMNLCTSRCEEIKWINKLLENSSYNKYENGFVLCCEFNEFRRTVTEMPPLEKINELLT